MCGFLSLEPIQICNLQLNVGLRRGRASGTRVLVGEQQSDKGITSENNVKPSSKITRAVDM